VLDVWYLSTLMTAEGGGGVPTEHVPIPEVVALAKVRVITTS
jgi:hypothetical protein